MDQLFYGFSKEKMISLTFVDVTESAKILEKQHLSGPTAGRFLGEALAAVALLSANLGNEDERISLQAQVSGQIGGCLVDASRNGNLRGYTMIKILNEFDHSDSTPLQQVLGDVGALTFLHSNRKNVIAQHRITCNPMNLRHGLARYFNDFEQKPTAIEISVTSRDHNLHRAVGICMSRYPEGQSEDFIPLLERFNDKTIEKALAHAVDINVLSKMLGLDDLAIIERRVLVAKCSCSHEKVIYSISCLPVEELEEILEQNEIPEVICHFCSKSYKIGPAEIARLLREKKERQEQD
ncbi:MAG: Hsp33 family molecular chaperone HslO [Candidatus Riflebacteria bacterium]|nr:Hsp33 family molecular chaperone HslO [Candidatus Riflebacteria bacterium]